eukprot:GHVS01057461.1.p2 GENE.GHVS01057461.1~~GHVS01057461.1.p2  ORF type:complete len:154 (-),score=14.33 GHVS01057461.1:23-484(-)
MQNNNPHACTWNIKKGGHVNMCACPKVNINVTAQDNVCAHVVTYFVSSSIISGLQPTGAGSRAAGDGSRRPGTVHRSRTNPGSVLKHRLTNLLRTKWRKLSRRYERNGGTAHSVNVLFGIFVVLGSTSWTRQFLLQSSQPCRIWTEHLFLGSR